MNSIKALLVDNPKAARRAIDLLSDLLRTSLYGNGALLIPLREEMALVEDYLELEKIRFEKRLETSIEIEEGVLHVKVLPLSIQVLVENAIKHGIAQKKEGGVISISISRNIETLEILVQNPGVLRQGLEKGLGLENLKERLTLKYNEKASFFIVQHNPESVSALIKIPLQ